MGRYPYSLRWGNWSKKMDNELERLRKENAELRAELAKYKQSHAKGANARSVARG